MNQSVIDYCNDSYGPFNFNFTFKGIPFIGSVNNFWFSEKNRRGQILSVKLDTVNIVLGKPDSEWPSCYFFRFNLNGSSIQYRFRELIIALNRPPIDFGPIISLRNLYGL